MNRSLPTISTTTGLPDQLRAAGPPPLPSESNIAPSQPVLAVRSTPDGQGREMVWLRWGLIPATATDPHVGNHLINARAETIAERPAFRDAFRHRRCLVLADGFYAWKRKRPHWVHFPDNRPFAMAGIWERWQKPGIEAVESCAVITVPANDLVRPFQARMPAILAPKDYEPWLDPGFQDVEQLRGLLRPSPDGELVAKPVSRDVNDPRRRISGKSKKTSGDEGGLLF